jgi:hypothetical protein
MTIKIRYPMLNREMNDSLGQKDAAIEVLLNIKAKLYEEISKIEAQLADLGYYKDTKVYLKEA